MELGTVAPCLLRAVSRAAGAGLDPQPRGAGAGATCPWAAGSVHRPAPAPALLPAALRSLLSARMP